MNACKPSSPHLALHALVALLLLLFSLPCAADAQTKGIAALVEFKGDIIVKNNGKWGIGLVKGIALYNGDKVVTRQGTALVVFHDGSELKIEPNSNVRIVERSVKKGFIFKDEVRQRRVRVLLGKTGYKENHSKSRETRMEAPTAVAALRGTEISFGVDDKGTAYGVILNGDWRTIGDVIAGEAPDLPSEIADRTPVQMSAVGASEAARQASVAASRASEAAKAAARPDAIATDKVSRVQEQAKTAKFVIQQALAAAKEGRVEAEMMGKNADPKVVKEALAATSKSDRAAAAMIVAALAADNAMEATKKIVALAEKATKTANVAAVNAALKAATAQAGAALAHAAVAEGNQAIIDAQTAGATDIAKEMEARLARTTELAARSTERAATAVSLAERATEATGAEAKAFEQAASANASAANALAATVHADTVGVIATVGGETQTANEAFNASGQASKFAEITLNLAVTATEAAEAGDLAGATVAAESADIFETKTEEVTRDVIPEPITTLDPGAESPPVVVSPAPEQVVTPQDIMHEPPPDEVYDDEVIIDDWKADEQPVEVSPQY